MSGRKHHPHPHVQEKTGWDRPLALLPLEMSVPAHIFLSHFLPRTLRSTSDSKLHMYLLPLREEDDNPFIGALLLAKVLLRGVCAQTRTPVEERVTFPCPHWLCTVGIQSPLASCRRRTCRRGGRDDCLHHSLTTLADPWPVPGGTSPPWKNHVNPTSKPPSPKRQPPSTLAPKCFPSLRAPDSFHPQLDPSPRHQNAYRQSSEINRDRPTTTTLGRRAFSWCVFIALTLVDPPKPPRSWTLGPGVVGPNPSEHPLGARSDGALPKCKQRRAGAGRETQSPDRTSHQTPVTAVAPVHRDGIVTARHSFIYELHELHELHPSTVVHITLDRGTFLGYRKCSFPSVEGCPDSPFPRKIT